MICFLILYKFKLNTTIVCNYQLNGYMFESKTQFKKIIRLFEKKNSELKQYFVLTQSNKNMFLPSKYCLFLNKQT